MWVVVVNVSSGEESSGTMGSFQLRGALLAARVVSSQATPKAKDVCSAT